MVNLVTNEFDNKVYPKVMGGIAVGPKRFPKNNGTIGGIFKHNGKFMLLSNHHVLVVDKNAQVGEPIEQPAGSGHVVAKLWAPWSISRKTDAALAEIVDPNVLCEIYKIGPIKGYANDADIKMLKDSGAHVRKRGAGSDYTEGKIIATNEKAPMGYKPLGEWSLNDQLLIKGLTPGRPFSREFDSGSCIMDDFGRVVGLLVGGDGENTYATPIETVMKQLNISLC
jgi:hypothetical protein